MTSDSTSQSRAPLPLEFFDSHHHFLDTRKNSFQTFLGSLLPNESYLPADYQKDIVQPLREAGVTFVGSTHIECMPDDGLAEASWVESISSSNISSACTVQAIVASTDLTLPRVLEDLTKLKAACPKLRGIRWILDAVGPFDGTTATHIAVTRHNSLDYLRGSEGGYQGSVVPNFERGIAALEKHGLSFDLQCAPEQLPAAEALFSKYPNLPVVLDHMGKPRTLLGPDDDMHRDGKVPNSAELEVWRRGMKAIAALPNVHVKLSMLGYAIPGWIRNDHRRALMRQLVRETVELFGPHRCMVATNFWKNAATSDADGFSDVGPDPVQLLTLLNEFLCDYSMEDRRAIFAETAKSFYKV